MTIAQIDWTPANLRRELVEMLQRTELAPLDLVRAWDQSNDFSFSSREFLIMMKKIVYSHAVINDPELTAMKEAKAVVLTKTGEAETEAAFQWKMTKAVSYTSEATANANAIGMLASTYNKASKGAEKAGVTAEEKAHQEELEAAAVKMQAMVRGRRVRTRSKAMSKEEGDRLWYTKIKPVCQHIFREIGGDDGSMDIEEFVRWINEEWRNMRVRQKQAKQSKAGAGQERKPGGASATAPGAAPATSAPAPAGASGGHPAEDTRAGEGDGEGLEEGEQGPQRVRHLPPCDELELSSLYSEAARDWAQSGLDQDSYHSRYYRDLIGKSDEYGRSASVAAGSSSQVYSHGGRVKLRSSSSAPTCRLVSLGSISSPASVTLGLLASPCARPARSPSALTQWRPHSATTLTAPLTTTLATTHFIAAAASAASLASDRPHSASPIVRLHATQWTSERAPPLPAGRTLGNPHVMPLHVPPSTRGAAYRPGAAARSLQPAAPGTLTIRKPARHGLAPTRPPAALAAAAHANAIAKEALPPSLDLIATSPRSLAIRDAVTGVVESVEAVTRRLATLSTSQPPRRNCR